MEASLDRIEGITHEKPDILDPEDPVELEKVRGQVTYGNVSFAYDKGARVEGSLVEGRTGRDCWDRGTQRGGQDDLHVNLLLRFYDPTEGAVRIDGHDVREIRQRDLRDAIAFVPQEPLLFNATAKENILIGRPDATDEEVEDAAHRARAHDFITAMERGYETMMGEKGARLSGGQRQRLALARAFLRNAPILVLDEAASALDSENEAMVQQALEELTKDKTVFIIAHRFSTLSIVNRILVFRGRSRDRGRSKRGAGEELPALPGAASVTEFRLDGDDGVGAPACSHRARVARGRRSRGRAARVGERLADPGKGMPGI